MFLGHIMILNMYPDILTSLQKHFIGLLGLSNKIRNVFDQPPVYWYRDNISGMSWDFHKMLTHWDF